MFRPIFRALTVLTAAGWLAIGGMATARAGTEDTKVVRAETHALDYDPFAKGTLELQVMSGVLFSVQRTTFLRPNFDIAVGVIRLGYMLDTPYGPGFLYGNDELMLEGFGGGVFVGEGNGLGGLSLVYRRNFLGIRKLVVPFIDLGAGGVYSDAYHVHPQRELGSPGEFDLQAGLGLRFFLGSHWSLDAEANFRHLSNADISGRNYGTNSIGGLIGVTRSF